MKIRHRWLQLFAFVIVAYSITPDSPPLARIATAASMAINGWDGK